MKLQLLSSAPRWTVQYSPPQQWLAFIWLQKICVLSSAETSALTLGQWRCGWNPPHLARDIFCVCAYACAFGFFPPPIECMAFDFSPLSLPKHNPAERTAGTLRWSIYLLTKAALRAREKQQVILGRRMTTWTDAKDSQAGCCSWSNCHNSLASFFAEDTLPVADALGTLIHQSGKFKLVTKWV